MPGPRLRLLAATLALLGVAWGALAQVPGTRFSLGTGPAVVTLDQERLFTDSAYGQAVMAAVDRSVQELTRRNRELETRLAEEERALTRRRAELPPEEFRALADTFDARVEEIRRNQEARGRAIGAFRDAQRQRFFEAALPVVTEVVTASGAVAVLDNRAIVLALDEIDITDRVLARLDTVLGDPDVPETVPDVPPPPPDGAEGPGLSGPPAPGSGPPRPRPLPPDAGGPPLDLPSPSIGD